jgi:hypothetical protein
VWGKMYHRPCRSVTERSNTTRADAVPLGDGGRVRVLTSDGSTTSGHGLPHLRGLRTFATDTLGLADRNGTRMHCERLLCSSPVVGDAARFTLVLCVLTQRWVYLDLLAASGLKLEFFTLNGKMYSCR